MADDIDFDRIAEDIKNALPVELTICAYIANSQMAENTPVLSGDLKRSYIVGNVSESGNVIEISGGTNKEYADWVESGHKTKDGGFVQGQFFMEKTLEQLSDTFEQRLHQAVLKAVNR